MQGEASEGSCGGWNISSSSLPRDCCRAEFHGGLDTILSRIAPLACHQRILTVLFSCRSSLFDARAGSLLVPLGGMASLAPWI